MQIQPNFGIGHLPSSTYKWIQENAKIYNQNFVSLRLLLTLSFVINVTSLALPIVLMQVYDRIIPNHSIGTAAVLLFGLFVFILAETGLKYLRYYIITFAGARYENDRSKDLIDNTISNPVFYNVGVFQYALKDIKKNKSFIAGQGIITLTELPFLFLYMGFLFYLNPIMAMVPIATLSLYLGISLYSIRNISRAIRLKHFKDIEKDNLLYKVLDNLIIIKKFGRGNLFTNRYKTAQKSASLYNYKVQKREHFHYNLSQLTSQLTSVGILAAGAYLVVHGDMGIGALAASIILANRSVSPANKIFQSLKKIHELKIMEDMAIKPEPRNENKDHEKLDSIYSMVMPLYIDKKRREIPFMKGDTISLQSVSEEVKRFLFFKELKYIRKKVYLNDIKMNKIDELTIYKKIAILNSKPNIWNGTVRDNITSFGLVSDTQARYFIEVLGLAKIIRKLPQGLDTYITSDISTEISEEIKSLIYITRKLALEPEIIVLNEFESNIDRENYVKIFHYISSIRDNRIIFINSQDQNLLNLCNRDLTNNRIGEVDQYLS